MLNFKKMKKKIYLIAFMVVGILACSDDFTETVEIGSLNPASLQTPAGIDFLLTAAYSTLDGVSGVSGGWAATGDNWWMDAISDDAHKGSTDGDQQELMNLETFNWTTGNGYLSAKWRALYAGVNRSNAVISVIEGGDDPSAFTNQLAQAYFLRGHFYFELARAFGYASIISKENFDAFEFNQPNNDPSAVWAQAESDMTFAVNNLPDNQGSEAARATSWAAKAYLGKIQLYQGNWSGALTTLDDVINNGPYALLPEFVDNFRLAGELGSESVFAINFDTAGGAFAPNGNQGGTLNFQGPNGWCCGFYQPSQDLANTFQTDGAGLPLLDTYNQTDVTNDYGIDAGGAFTPHAGPLDPRIDYTIGRRGINYNNWDINPGKSWVRAGFSDISGPYIAKKNVYYNGEDANMGAGNWGQQHSGINYNVIRYADVLLMAAEAAVETNDLAKAVGYVDQVRQRAIDMTNVSNDGGATDAANYDIATYGSFADQATARKAVRMERRLELSMEGHRLYDIRRWGNGPTLMAEYVTNEKRTMDQSNYDGKFSAYQAKHNLFPVPIGAIDQSAGALTQNPDW